MTSFALKIKTKDGQQILRTLTSTSTVSDLKQQLFNICSIPTCRLHVLSGFPPKSFDLSKDDQELGDAGLSTGDTLIVEEKSDNKSVTNISQDKDAKPVPALEPQAKHHVSNNEPARNGILLKQVVPADNSCLFTSIYFVLNGKIDQTGDVSKLMRQHVAETISREPYNYTDAFLGKPNEEYCKWILDDKSWGGAIEISVMSSHYGIEIAVVDTINGIINRFGEDQKYAHRVLLFFDGIHYDPLYLEPFHGGEIQTIFPAENDSILAEALQLANEAQSSRQYTDVNKFTLKCMVCSVHLTGQVQAQQHAQSTGHANFGEV